MKIAIVGTTQHGQAIGRLLADNGHDVSVSDTYAPDRAAPVAAGIAPDASAQTPYQQAAVSDVLILAIRWEDLDQVLTAMGPPPESAVIVDATRPRHPGSRSGAEMLSARLNTHRLVEAFGRAQERRRDGKPRRLGPLEKRLEAQGEALEIGAVETVSLPVKDDGQDMVSATLLYQRQVIRTNNRLGLLCDRKQ